MLSPVIKTKTFNKESGLLRASIDNLPVGSVVSIQFLNLDFKNINDKIIYDEEINWDLINTKDSFGFSLIVDNDFDRFLFVQIKILDKGSWVDFGVASFVIRDEDSISGNEVLSVSKHYISRNDKLEIQVRAEPSTVYDLKINDKSFGFKTDASGYSNLFLDPINFIEQSIISSKFVRSVSISLNSRVGGNNIATTKVDFVPESLYALAATNDPSRPSCVILDPDPVPAFSVSSDPLSDFCYDQPLVGRAFFADGRDASNTTRLDSKYVNCSNGYVSSAISVVNSACKIYDSPKFVRLEQPLRHEGFPAPASDSPSLYGLFKRDWLTHRFGFCYSACDENAESDGVAVDPCAFSGKELRKVPRVWAGLTADAIGVSVSYVSRGIIKAPLPYFHSVILKTNQIRYGDAVNVIFDLASGERISKSLTYSQEFHSDISSFVQSFAASISSDISIVNAGILVDVYDNIGRIDFKSRKEFYIYPGQIESINKVTGDYIKNDKIQVIKDSKYAFDFEITDPSRIDDIENIFTKNNVTHALFLSGDFKGMMLAINKNDKNGNIVLDTCPRVSGIGEQRSGLGAFVVTEDQPCTYVAFVSLNSPIPSDSSVKLKKLPFVKNRFNEVVPSIKPCMTSDGRIFCQAMIDGKWQIFGYFPPSIGDFSSNSLNENYWIQLTDIGENRNVSAASDYHGNIHLCWETDRFGFTSLQYSCIGKSQKLINRLAMSGMFSKKIPPDLFSKIFSLNKNKVIDNFDQSQSSNITIIREGGIVSLVPGASVTGKSFSIVREFTGYLNISEVDFSAISQESPGSKIGAVLWSGEKPYFGNNSFVTSYLVHFEKKTSRISENESSQFTAKFKGKILKIFVSGTDMADSSRFFSSSSIRYPSQAVSFDSSLSVVSGSVSVVDENTVNFTFLYSGSSDIGPLQMRILVEGVYENDSLDQSEWNRIYSNGGMVSVPSSYGVCTSGYPYSDTALGVLSVNKDYSGNYIEGQESNIDFSVNCEVSISPSFPVSKFINGPEIKILDSENTDFVLERQDDSYIWIGDNQPIIIIEEFSGEPGFDQSPQYPSDFSYGGVRFEDTSKKYLPGFSSSSNVFSLSLSIRSPELLESKNKSIYFDSPIVAIYVDESDLDYTDPILGNSVSSRTGYADAQNVKFLISKSRKILNINLPSQTEIDFSIRVVLGGDLILNPFYNKSDSDLEKMFKEFTESFDFIGSSVFSFNGNRFTVNKTEKRYDTFIPVLGSLKFDDINSNPKADFSKFSNLYQLSSSSEVIDVVGCSNISSSGTFEMNSNFKVDGVDANLHHSYIFLIPERVSFVAKNSETLDEYSLRNGSIKGYREAVVTDVYTGLAKIGILSNGFYSAGLDTTFSKGVQLKIQDNPSVDISNPIKLQVDFSYLRLSREDVKIIERWSHPAEDAFFVPEKQKPFYHLVTNVYVNDYPQVSANSQVDLSLKSRQWDFGFGMPFGLNPISRSENINIFELLSKDKWEISFSNIKIGSPTVVINRDYFENAESNYSFGKILSLVPNSDSNIENETFNQSIIDPGDWTCLENENLLIDEWRAVHGGVIYCGSYVNPINGSRSVILESNIPYSSSSVSGYYYLPMNSLRRGRVSSGCFGGISQEFGTLKANLDYEHYINITFGLRPLPEQLPKVAKSLLIFVDGNVYSGRYLVPTGNFESSSSPLDMTTITRSFSPSGQNLQLKILNVSDNLSQSFSGYHFTTNSECPLRNGYSSHIVGTIYKNAIFYIDRNGRLVCSLSSSRLDSTVDTVTASIGGQFDYMAVDSRLRYENNDNNNPFAIAIDKNGYLKSVTFDGSQDEIPNSFKQINLPEDSGFVNVSLGWNHGAAIKLDGTVVCWGDNTYGQCNVPAGSKFLHVKCGQDYTIGIKQDGTLSAWGRDNYNQITNLPGGHFVKIDAGSEHAVGIRIDGTPVSWGRNDNISDPSIQMVDVCACGGNVYTLQASDPLSFGVYNVKPFNIGIGVDGNLIAWGDYVEAFGKLDDSIENIHSQPPVPCVALKGGIRSCLALGADSKIYAYGISPSPSQSDLASPLTSLYKHNTDYFSGGFVIDDCKVFSSNNLVDESSPVDAHRLIGLESKDAMNFTFGLYSYGINSVPVCDSSFIIQKNPTVHCDKFDKISIVYEDNSLGPWGVMERSSIYLDRYLLDKIPLSNKLYSSFNPSIDSDDYGRRVVVWNSIKDKNYLIEHARSESHPDYVSDCEVDRIISGSRILGFDSDPYDPYELEKSLMSCRVNLSFIAPSFSTYFFTISFVDMNDENIIYKTSSSKIEPGKWLVNGSYLPYNGKVLDAGESVVVTYLPDSEDNIFGRVLKVILNYTTEIMGQEDFQITKLHNITDGSKFYNDGSGPPYNINGTVPFYGTGEGQLSEYLIFEEAGKNSTISIPKQDSSYFESQGTDSERNLTFPEGLSSLPGVESGSFAKSFLVVLGDDGNSSNSIVEASVTFSAPIAAILIDDVSLSVTDNEFRDLSNPVFISRKKFISVFQFYSGEYLRIGEDRRTLYMRFYVPRKGSWPGSGEEKSKNTSKPSSGNLSSQDQISAVISGNQDLSASLASFSVDSDLSGPGDLSALSSSVEFPFATFRVILSSSGNASGSVESIFYCAKPIDKNCRINAVYKNSSYEQQYVHFKVSVYSDPEYSDSLMTFSSMDDSGLWNIGIENLPSQGLGITSGSSASVSFNPPLIDPVFGYYPIDSRNVQEYYSVGSSYMDYYNLDRRAFVCGIKYYIKVSAIIESDELELYRSSFACECSKKFSDREGLLNWVSPYNGSSNVEISSGVSRKSSPSVAGSRGGLFMVAWEDCRGAENYGGIINNNNIFSDIYSAIIDLSKNKIESSVYQSQERIVKNTSSDLGIVEERSPVVKSDYFGNFSIFSTIDHNQIDLKHMSVGYKISPNIIKESAIVTACSFTLTESNSYKSAFEGGEFLDIRISEKYIRGRVFSGSINPVTVVNDCFVEIEVVGVPGAMGYRVKNESEVDFTEWIPIGSDLQPISSLGESILPDDEEFRKTFKARWIGNEIFVFPWILSNGNGVKKVCIEVLTAFGKTQQICLDVIAEYSAVSYSLEVMYSMENKNVPIFSPIKYKGIPVVNRKTWYLSQTNGDNIVLSKNDLRSLNLENDEYANVELFIKINFEDPDRIMRLLSLSRLKKLVERRSSRNEFSLTMYQQGSIVQESPIQVLNEKNGEYFGKFTINKNNGVTFKDGLGFISVNIPFECFNPFVKNFSSVARVLSDNRLDRSSVKIQDNNKFIENYINVDKRNLFGTKRVNP